MLEIQQEILAADHLVFVYPNWWATFPALLKGFIDRVFLPNFAFKYRENSPFCDKYIERQIGKADSNDGYSQMVLLAGE